MIRHTDEPLVKNGLILSYFFTTFTLSQMFRGELYDLPQGIVDSLL